MPSSPSTCNSAIAAMQRSNIVDLPPVISKIYDEHACGFAGCIGCCQRRSSELSVPNVDNQQQNDTKSGLDKQYSNGDSGSEDHTTHQLTPLDNVISPATAHQPQRLPSLDDFASQGSNVSSHSQSP